MKDLFNFIIGTIIVIIIAIPMFILSILADNEPKRMN